MANIRLLYIIIFILTSRSVVTGQNSDFPKQVTDVYLIQNATIHAAPGKVLKKTDVLVRKGIIAKVAKKIDPPYDAQIIEGDSLHVYPAFIGAASYACKNTRIRKKYDIRDTGNPPMEAAGITPQYSVADHIDRDEIEPYRKAGFGYIHILPELGMMPGMGSIISSGDDKSSNIFVSMDYAQHIRFRGVRQMYPSNTLGVMAKIRDIFHNAAIAKKHEIKFGRQPQGLQRPEHIKEYKALYPYIDKKKPVYFLTPTGRHILRAQRLQKELDLDVVLTDVKKVAGFLDDVRLPVLLSLNIPDNTKKSKDSISSMPPMRRAHYEKQWEAYQEVMKQPTLLKKKNIPFAFSLIGVQPQDIKKRILRFMEYGMTKEDALKALTTAPAALMSIDQQCGTIEEGKNANMFISNTPYFQEKSKIIYTLIDGVLEENISKNTLKKLYELLGRWSFRLPLKDAVREGIFTVSEKNDKLKVEFYETAAPHIKINATDVKLEDGVLSFTAKMLSADDNTTLKVSLNIDGTSYKGTVDASGWRVYDVSGKKLPTPPKKKR